MHDKTRKAVVTGASGFIGQALVAHLRASGLARARRRSEAVPGCRAGGDVGGRRPAGRARPRRRSPTRPSSISRLRPTWRPRWPARGATSRTRSAACSRCSRRRGRPTAASSFRRRRRSSMPAIRSRFRSARFPRPTSPYAAGKLGGEAYCHAYHRSYGLDVRIARLFSVYGAGMYRFAIHDIVRKIQANPKEIQILGDGTQIRDYLYIDDAVRGLEMIATEAQRRRGIQPGVWHPGASCSISTRTIAELMGYPDIRIVPDRQIVSRRHAPLVRGHLEDSGARVRAEVDLRGGLQRTIAWLLGDAERRWRSCMIRVRDEVAYCAAWKAGRRVQLRAQSARAPARRSASATRPFARTTRRTPTSGAASRCRATATCGFAYSLPPENIHSVLRRLARRSVGSGRDRRQRLDRAGADARSTTPGGPSWRSRMAISTTTTTSRCDISDTIDAYVTYSERMFQRLRELLPDRHDTIFLLPYGVDIPAEVRRPAAGPLRLLYVGRLTRRKGVFDLPADRCDAFASAASPCRGPCRARGRTRRP